MQTWKLEVEINVSDHWVADGYEATPERVARLLEEEGNVLCDVSAKTISAPDPAVIRELQGVKP